MIKTFFNILIFMFSGILLSILAIIAKPASIDFHLPLGLQNNEFALVAIFGSMGILLYLPVNFILTLSKRRRLLEDSRFLISCAIGLYVLLFFIALQKSMISVMFTTDLKGVLFFLASRGMLIIFILVSSFLTAVVLWFIQTRILFRRKAPYNWLYPVLLCFFVIISGLKLYSKTGAGKTGADFFNSIKGTALSNPLNIILITLDTTRPDFLGCYGKKEIKTPNIDKICAQGVKFEHCYSTCNSTTPSHASILTSLYVEEHEVSSNYHKLPNQIHTMADVFSALGYKTAGFTSVFFLNPKISGLNKGFESFEYPEQAGELRAGEITKRALTWFDGYRKSKNAPFFVWAHYYDAHMIYNPPEGYKNLYYSGNPYDPDNFDFKRIPTYHKIAEEYAGITDLKYIENLYMGEITYMDSEIGNFINQLSEWGLMENTAVFIVADHGEGLGEHLLFYNHKGLYQTSLHVPLICFYPKVFSPGTAVSSIVSTVDIFPTMLDIIGVTKPDFVKGNSFIPLVNGRIDATNKYVFAQDPKNSVAVIGTKWKLIYPNKILYSQATFCHADNELYDIENDPSELENHHYKNPQMVKEMINLIVDWKKAHSSKVSPVQSKITDKDMEKLKALGYMK